MLTKLALVLEELGVPARPIPTKLSCDAYDALRQGYCDALYRCKIGDLERFGTAADAPCGGDQHARAQHAARAASNIRERKQRAAPKRTAPQVTRGQVQKRRGARLSRDPFEVSRRWRLGDVSPPPETPLFRGALV